MNLATCYIVVERAAATSRRNRKEIKITTKTGRRKLTVVALLITFGVLAWQTAHAVPVFINELHYDNVGTDVGEFVEIAGPAGTSLSGWSLVLYNGSNGSVYDTINLSGSIDNEGNGFGAVDFQLPTNGLQNGAPDGLALIDNTASVIQFLSYEGSFTAVGGAANGMTSTDIGVVETASTPVGDSLQLIGTGTMYEDFTWTDPVDSPGDINAGQTLVPEPSTLFLLAGALAGLIVCGSRCPKD